MRREEPGRESFAQRKISAERTEQRKFSAERTEQRKFCTEKNRAEKDCAEKALCRSGTTGIRESRDIRRKEDRMQDIIAILEKLDWSPLFISLKTGIVATFISFFLGIFAARKVVKASNRVKAIVDGLLTLPMVLPPTVAGFFLLLLFSKRRPLGILLYEEFGIKVVQSWLGCIVAATVIAFPLMYRNARAAFEQIDVNLIYAGRTLGMSDIRIFWTVVMPTAGPGIAAGTILTFARALGEYGATSMLAGNIPGKTATVSQRIAMVIQDGDYLTAGVWTAIVVLIAFIIVFLMNIISGKAMKSVKRW